MKIFLAPHGRSRPLLKGVERAGPECFSYPNDNMHGQKPNKHKPQHHVHGIQRYAALFVCHNAMPVLKIYSFSSAYYLSINFTMLRKLKEKKIGIQIII